VKSVVAGMVLGLVGATTAAAGPHLDGKVYAPYVENGIFELEARGAQVNGGPLDGASTTVLEAEYGFGDRLSLALVAPIANDPGQGAKLQGLGVEGVYYLGQIPKVGVDVGLYGEYLAGVNGGEEVVEAKLLLAKRTGAFEGVLNLVAERPLNVPTERYANYSYAAAATWEVVDDLRLGIEAFGDLGDDYGLKSGGAYVGPVAQWEFHPKGAPFEIEMRASWLAATGSSRDDADSQVRLTVGLERKF
jgi:hypothetical protein